MYKGMYVYPWDLAEEGIDVVVDRLLEAGINTVNVTASYHAGKFLRPHAPRRRVMFPDDGTVYFRPSPARYRDTPLRPLMNALVEEHDIFGLGRSLRRARAGGRRVGCGPPQLAPRARPPAARRPKRLRRRLSLQPMSQSPGGPCLSSRAARGCCRDASRPAAGPRVLRVLRTITATTTRCRWCRPTRGHRRCCWRWRSCPACLRRAAADGIDGQRVGAAVRGALDAFYAAPGLPDPSDRQVVQWVVADLLEDPEMAAYLRAAWRPSPHCSERAAPCCRRRCRSRCSRRSTRPRHKDGSGGVPLVAGRPGARRRSARPSG